MLQLQETRKKSRHLLPKQATFVGSRRDSETQFVSRDLRGDWGDQSPHPYSPPFSSSQNHPRPHPAPHNGEVKAPPGCVPLFVRGSIPNSTSRPPHRRFLRGSAQAAPGPAPNAAAPPMPPSVPVLVPVPGGRLRAPPAEQTWGHGERVSGQHFPSPPLRDPAVLLISCPTTSEFKG